MCVSCVSALFASGCEHAVAQQDAEERTDERGGDVVADDGGRRVHVAHRHDDAEHRGDDAEARQRVADGLDEAGREVTLELERIELGVEQRLEVVGRDAVDDLLERLGEERQRVVRLGDAGILLEDVGLRGIVDVGLEREHALAAREHEQLVLALEEVEVVRLLRDRSSFIDDLDRVEDALLHQAGSRRDERADRRTEDDDELRRLDQYAEMAAGHREPAADSSEHDEDSGQCHDNRANRPHPEPIEVRRRLHGTVTCVGYVIPTVVAAGVRAQAAVHPLRRRRSCSHRRSIRSGRVRRCGS